MSTLSALHKLRLLSFSVSGLDLPPQGPGAPVVAASHSSGSDTYFSVSGPGVLHTVVTYHKDLEKALWDFAWETERQVTVAGLSVLTSEGFVPANMIKDFGYPLKGVHYFFKKHPNGQHTYVSLSTYKGQFVEGNWETFACVKETRVKGKPNDKDRVRLGYSPLASGLFRNLEDMKAHLGPVTP